MAVLTFPLPQATLGDTLPIASVVWSPLWQQEFSGLGTGEWLTADLAPMLWEGEVALRPLLHTDARALMAKLTALGGSAKAFYLANPLGWYPAQDPRGDTISAADWILADGTWDDTGVWIDGLAWSNTGEGFTPTILNIAVARNELSFTGLPAGYILSSGDFFAVTDASNRRHLIQLVGSGTANGSGATGLIEARPVLRSSITTTLAVTFAKPAAKVKIVPGSLSQQMHNANRTRITFTARQTLQAS